MGTERLFGGGQHFPHAYGDTSLYDEVDELVSKTAFLTVFHTLHYQNILLKCTLYALFLLLTHLCKYLFCGSMQKTHFL